MTTPRSYVEIVHDLLYGGTKRRRSERIAKKEGQRRRAKHPVVGCALEEDDGEDCPSGWSEELFGCVEPPIGATVMINSACMTRDSWKRLWMRRYAELELDANQEQARAWLDAPVNPFTRSPFTRSEIESIFGNETPEQWAERNPRLLERERRELLEGLSFDAWREGELEVEVEMEEDEEEDEEELQVEEEEYEEELEVEEEENEEELQVEEEVYGRFEAFVQEFGTSMLTKLNDELRMCHILVLCETLPFVMRVAFDRDLQIEPCETESDTDRRFSLKAFSKAELYSMQCRLNAVLDIDLSQIQQQTWIDDLLYSPRAGEMYVSFRLDAWRDLVRYYPPQSGLILHNEALYQNDLLPTIDQRIVSKLSPGHEQTLRDKLVNDASVFASFSRLTDGTPIETRKPIDVDATSAGSCLVREAVVARSEVLLMELLRNGADPDGLRRTRNDDVTPLRYIVQHEDWHADEKSRGLVTYLVTAGADVSVFSDPQLRNIANSTGASSMEFLVNRVITHGGIERNMQPSDVQREMELAGDLRAVTFETTPGVVTMRITFQRQYADSTETCSIPFAYNDERRSYNIHRTMFRVLLSVRHHDYEQLAIPWPYQALAPGVQPVSAAR